MNIDKNIKYIEIEDFSAQSTVRINDVETFLKLISKYQPNFVMVKKQSFVKHVFNMSKESRAALLGNPYPTFSMESFGYEFRDKTGSDIDYGIKGPVIKRVKGKVWHLCSSDPEYDSEYGPPRLENPQFDYKIVDNGEELEVYKYLDKVEGGNIEKLTEFVIIHDQVAYILTEYNALSNKINPSSKDFDLHIDEESWNDFNKPSINRQGDGDSRNEGNQDESYFMVGRIKVPKNPRADVFNPNNPSYKAARDNRANQLNPKHSAYRKSRRKK